MVERGSPANSKTPVAEWVYAEDYDKLYTATKNLIYAIEALRDYKINAWDDVYAAMAIIERLEVE